MALPEFNLGLGKVRRLFHRKTEAEQAQTVEQMRVLEQELLDKSGVLELFTRVLDVKSFYKQTSEGKSPVIEKTGPYYLDGYPHHSAVARWNWEGEAGREIAHNWSDYYPVEEWDEVRVSPRLDSGGILIAAEQLILLKPEHFGRKRLVLDVLRWTRQHPARMGTLAQNYYSGFSTFYPEWPGSAISRSSNFSGNPYIGDLLGPPVEVQRWLDHSSPVS